MRLFSSRCLGWNWGGVVLILWAVTAEERGHPLRPQRKPCPLLEYFKLIAMFEGELDPFGMSLCWLPSEPIQNWFATSHHTSQFSSQRLLRGKHYYYRREFTRIKDFFLLISMTLPYADLLSTRLSDLWDHQKWGCACIRWASSYLRLLYLPFPREEILEWALRFLALEDL